MSFRKKSGRLIHKVELDIVDRNGIALLNARVLERLYNALIAKHALEELKRFVIVEIDIVTEPYKPFAQRRHRR